MPFQSLYSPMRCPELEDSSSFIGEIVIDARGVIIFLSSNVKYVEIE